jgi:hypothetical protein
MAGDARDLPLSAIDSRSEFVVFSHRLGEFVVFSHRLGLIGELATASDAVRKLVEHLRALPGSDAAVFKRTQLAWKIF